MIDVVTSALVSAGIPATKETVGLLRSDGKRPDGLTLVPWQSGKPLTWDVTVAHTLAASCQLYGSRSRRCGRDGSDPEVIQIRRHFSFAPFSADRFRDSGLHELFCGFLLPGFGPQNQPGLGDSREASYLFQRIAVTIQLFNSVLFRNSFVAYESQDDSDASHSSF